MKAKRIGPRMESCAAYVARNPGCHPVDVARAVGPNGSTQYGYRIVGRALAAGLIKSEPDPRHKCRTLLYPSSADGGES